ncbi:unnamed protein product [Microthlaspi erraticum]|nr:unnamed protein product [Microthlaspi erraticum]
MTPGVFPSNGIFTNLDFLLWRVKENQVPDKTIDQFPWIVWQLWKARNAKVFENADITPEHTFQLAHAETEAWFAAQILEEVIDEDTITLSTVVQEEPPINFPGCQVDASWGIYSYFIGMGLVLDHESGDNVYGASARSQVLSPLHAEFAALIWAMKVALQLGYTSLSFETDCLQLVTIIEEEDWPSLASELDEFQLIHASFIYFSLSFIPRLCNVCADCLSKGERACGFSFTHVNPSIPSWAALEAVLIG